MVKFYLRRSCAINPTGLQTRPDLKAVRLVVSNYGQILDASLKTALVRGHCRHSSVGLERLICNQQVVGSNPTAGSSNFRLESLAVASHPLQSIADFRLGLSANCARNPLSKVLLRSVGIPRP